MTEDPTDYAPRPADDYHAGLVGAFMLDDEPALDRLTSFTTRFFESEPEVCDQLGVPFSKLPTLP